MATFGYKDLKIELDSAALTLQNISAFVTSINGWSQERLVEELTAAGDTTDRYGAIGFLKKNDVQLTGPYDNTVNGLVDIAKNWQDDSQRTLKLTFDGATAADTRTVETLLSKWDRNPKRGALHEVILTLKPTGAIT